MPLYPAISATSGIDLDTSSISTKSTVTLVANAIKQILVPNPTRSTIIISNPNLTTLYLDLSADLTATSYCYYLTKGQTQIFDFRWTGGVWALSKSARTFEIRELLPEGLASG